MISTFCVTTVFSTVLVLIIIRKYRERNWGKCTNNVKLNGKIAIVTGANSGIGYEIAKELALRKAQVILACRNKNTARDAMNRINKELRNNPQLVPMKLDLSSLSSVKEFAANVKEKYPEIHILINNAGVAYPDKKRVLTEDGFEIHFGVNHLGHFYLTNLLLDPLSRGHGRVVIVSSSLHEKGEINIEDLNSFKPVSKKRNLYANSKLANVYFARELATRVKYKNINVYSLCPGWVYTGLFRHSFRWYHYILILPIAFLFMRSPKQGAQTAIYCATEPELEKSNGLLFRDCKEYKSKAIFYENIQNKLWEESEKMIEAVVKKE